MPPPAGTLDQGLGGLHQKLADEHGIGYIGCSGITFYANVANHASTINESQLYVGQKPTVLSTNFLAVTVDLSRYGIPDGQVAATGGVQATSWNPLGPRTVNLGTLSYCQALFNKRVEAKFGLLANSFEFVGPFTASSLSGSVFGPQGNIISETGTSALRYPTLGLNIIGHVTENMYDKIGVARATHPDGTIAEHNCNPSGLPGSMCRTQAAMSSTGSDTCALQRQASRKHGSAAAACSATAAARNWTIPEPVAGTTMQRTPWLTGSSCKRRLLLARSLPWFVRRPHVRVRPGKLQQVSPILRGQDIRPGHHTQPPARPDIARVHEHCLQPDPPLTPQWPAAS